jgi:hypothetical protein
MLILQTMPKRDTETVLTAQQERFAQEVVKGASQSDAYRRAYPRSRKWEAKSVHEAASKLATKVSPRIHALQTSKREYVERKLQVDGAWVDERLIEVVERSMQHRPILDRNGDPVHVETPAGQIAPAYVFDAKAAVAALKLLGLDLGKFTQRHAVVPDPFAKVPVSVLKEALEALDRMSRERVIEHVPAGKDSL